MSFLTSVKIRVLTWNSLEITLHWFPKRKEEWKAVALCDVSYQVWHYNVNNVGLWDYKQWLISNLKKWNHEEWNFVYYEVGFRRCMLSLILENSRAFYVSFLDTFNACKTLKILKCMKWSWEWYTLIGYCIIKLAKLFKWVLHC